MKNWPLLVLYSVAVLVLSVSYLDFKNSGARADQTASSLYMNVSKVMRLENPCDNPIVSAHRGFKQIIVQLILPNEKDDKKQPFPSSLIRENISPDIEKIISKNFAPCLKAKTILDPAVVMTHRRIDQMMNPDNLVFIIEVNYPMYAGLNKDGARYAVLHSTTFRAGMNPHASIMSAYDTEAFIINPDEPLQPQLEFGLRLLRPDQFSGMPF